VEQVSISGGDGQTPRHHYGFADLLNRLNLPTPTRGTVVKMLGNGVPGAVGQGRVALLPCLEMPWINGARQIGKGFGSGTKSEFQGAAAGCLSAVTGCLEHLIEPLWVSML
jgi:hypothetical protein